AGRATSGHRAGGTRASLWSAGRRRRRAAAGGTAGPPRCRWPRRRPARCPSRPAPRRRGASGPALRQQFDRPLDRNRVHVVAPAQRGVGLPVGHVPAVPALLDHDGTARRRVLPEFPQGRGGGPPAATGFGLVEQFLCLGERDGEELLFAIEGTTVAAPLHIRPIPSVLHSDSLAVEL